MAQQGWNEFATGLTSFVGRHWPGLHRGAILLPCIGDSMTFAVIFGNNDFEAMDITQLEVNLIRDQLRDDTDMETLGFGTSPDCRTWTLVVRHRGKALPTVAGQIMRCELLKIRLEDVVRKAWVAVYSQIAQDALVRLAE
jgi:hypothetical protein